MKYVLSVIGVLCVLMGIGYVFDKNFFTTQVSYILIFTVILLGAWAFLRFIQSR